MRETFETYAFDLATSNDLELRKFNNSSEVLANLKAGIINYALIGRKAYTFEITDDIREVPLQNLGYTLVGPEKRIVEYSQLKDIVVHTYLDEKIVQEYLPFETEVIYYETINEILHRDVKLISWEDFKDDFNLIVPVIKDVKVTKFRTPILYMK